MKARYLLLSLFICSAWLSFAQPNTVLPPDKGEEGLKTGISNLPPGDVRTMAEWEQVEAIVIAWQNNYREILAEIALHAAQECTVYVLAADPVAVGFTLQLAGVDMDQVEILGLGYNSVWIRDYGPWTVYEDQVSERGISDFRYNRPLRVEDDLVPYEVADYLGISLFNADETPYQWIHSGGNFLRDGLGNAYSSDLVLRENSGKTGQELARYAKLFFGIDDYRIVNRLQYDTIHHLDMHMRILDEETIAVGYYPEGEGDGPWIEENLTYLTNNYRTPYGKPYRIMRLEMPPHNGYYPPIGNYRTYTNSVFVNNTILVPTYEAAYDSVALRQYRDYFPGYKVQGINCNDIIGQLGALHCITKLIGVNEPLWIAHPRLQDTYEAEEGIAVEAWVYHDTGIREVKLHYREAGDSHFSQLTMQVDATNASRWYAEIPAQTAGTNMEYYLSAEANNGQQQKRPPMAPLGFYPFRVKGWTEAPEANWVQRKAEVAPGSDILFTNTSQHGTTELYWSFPGGEPSIATGENVVVNYPESGTYNVRLVAVNPEGRDTLLQMAAVEVREAFAPFKEKFNADLGNRWEVDNPDTENVAWEWFESNSCNEGCLRVPHREANRKLNREYLRTAIDLRAHNQPHLTFDVAYAQRIAAHFDELRVNLVDQQGERHNIYNKGGDVLATRTDYLADFAPQACTDWRTDTIDLTAWQGQQFVLEIESIGDRGNSIYLDNFHLQANALPQLSITSPADETLYIGTGEPISATVRASAEDADGEIVRVEFFLNGEYIGLLTDPPYEQTFTLPSWGPYTLDARAIDNAETAVWAETVNLAYDFDSSIMENGELPLDAQLGPNPAREQIWLRMDSPQAYFGLSFSITDTYGRVLREWSQDVAVGQHEIVIPTGQFPAATYWLRLAHGKQELSLRWVKG